MRKTQLPRRSRLEKRGSVPNLKRLTWEAVLGLVLLAFGMFLWIGLASYHDDVGDRFWTEHGYPNLIPWNIQPWMMPLTFGPLVVVSAARLGWWVLTRTLTRNAVYSGQSN